MLDKIKNAGKKVTDVKALASKSKNMVDINASQAKIQSAKNIKNVWKD